jgi:hypothetical protein
LILPNGTTRPKAEAARFNYWRGTLILSLPGG